MKILFATPLFPPEIGGPATYTKEITEKLKKDHKITILAYANNPVSIEGIELITISKQKPLPCRLFKYFLEIRRLAKQVDIIHAQNAVASGLPAVLAGHSRKKPVVIRFVGDEAWERAYQEGITTKHLDDWLKSPDTKLKIKIIMLIQRFVFRQVDRIMTPSAYLKKVLVEGYGINPDKVIVNYNASKQPEEYKDKMFPVEKKKHQILTTARMVSWKGIDGVIKAVDLVRKKNPDIHLIVAGDGPELEKLKSLAKKLNIDDNVTFLGRVSKNETESLRRESTIYILNSTYEGLPHTVLTCFGVGIPVIATNIPGTNEAAIDGKTAMLVPPDDPETLAVVIEKLMADTQQQKLLVANGQKLLSEKFSWKTHISNLLSLSESLITKPRN